MRKIRQRESLFSRFARKIDRLENGCWQWLGAPATGGYGRLSVGSHGGIQAHRFAFETFRYPIPDGLETDHLCRNRRCVNPFHLELVTSAENVLRGIGPGALNAKKTHCKYGHEFNAENTRYYFRRGKQERSCRACTKRRNAESDVRYALKLKQEHEHSYGIKCEVCGRHGVILMSESTIHGYAHIFCKWHWIGWTKTHPPSQRLWKKLGQTIS